ncbi:ATP-dependent DNA helicase Rep [Salmonella enterica subsp. enterica]|uniref:ATP-dependent DNA helicase Rep n=1 Tax=Salmonella enterica I TaxID=59201 RepID=A0A379UYS1_SALET|nr:ATP-dependent DNA helicase Rep [Salmonella enterica subsp. enterica]
MKSNFSLFDDTDQVALLKELTEGLIEDDKVLLQQLISTISNWKNDLKTPAQAAAGRKVNAIVFLPTATGFTTPI